MSETPGNQQPKKTSKTKAIKKGISKLVKSPKKSHPAILTLNDGSGSSTGGNKTGTLSYDYRARQNAKFNQDGILKRSKSLNQIDNKDDDDTESLNSAATISVFRSVHFDSTKNLEEGRISDSGWASSSKTSTSNGAAAPRVIVHDSDYIQPHQAASGNQSGNSDYAQVSGSGNRVIVHDSDYIQPHQAASGNQSGNSDYAQVSGSGNRVSASSDHIHDQGHRSTTLPRNTKLRSFSNGSDGEADGGRSSQNGGQIQRSQTVPRSKDLDNLGVIKLVASTQHLASTPPSSPPVTTVVPIQFPQQDLSRVQGITNAQLRELEERIERKVRRTVDKILRKQKETGAPSLSGTNQKLTVWECMVLEIQREMEILYIEKVKKERHLIRKDVIKKLEAEKTPTQENGTQANLTVVEARPFIKPEEVQHTEFESQTDAIPEQEIEIESLNGRLRSLQADYNKLRRQYNDQMEEMEKIRTELTHKRSNELAEADVIRDLQMKLSYLERERNQMESLYEEKVTEIKTLTLEYRQNVMNLEGQIKQEPKMANVKVQVTPDVYDTGIQSSIRTSDLWTYTDAGKQYADSSDLQIQVNTVTRDEGSSTVATSRFDVGLQCSPATRDASDSTMLSMAELEEMEEYADLYRLEREETEIVTKRVRSETPELPDNSLILKYLETSGNRSDDMITAVGVLLKSDEAHTVSLESMRYMDVDTTTDQMSGDSTTGYYSKVTDSNGFSDRPMTSLKFSSLRSDTTYGINGNGHLSDKDLTGSGRGYYSTSGSYFTDAERRTTTKLTSTPQSDHDYSFEINTSSMGRPGFESNGSISSERPMRRFLKYGVAGQQQQHPVIDLRTHSYLPDP